MPIIDTLIEPHGVTRVFFDCRNAALHPADQRRVEEAIKTSIVLAQAEDAAYNTAEMLPPAISSAREGGARALV